ncbi:MAG: hypothetical protein ABI168_06540 [Ginsengibacter sp.]
MSGWDETQPWNKDSGLCITTLWHLIFQKIKFMSGFIWQKEEKSKLGASWIKSFSDIKDYQFYTLLLLLLSNS